MHIEQTLRTIGLTGSEIKIYLALLKIGLSSKTAILHEARIAPSKIYIVLDKLIEKGLASMILKDNIKHYSAAPVNRIKEYLDKKKEEIAEEEEALTRILPALAKLQKSRSQETKTEVFFGWKGMDTAYSTLFQATKPKKEYFVLGASYGVEPQRTKRFYIRQNFIFRSKNIKLRIIFNENSRNYVAQQEEEGAMVYHKKFLPKTSPVEIAIVKGIVAIVMLKKEPLVILIHDQETANSFITYFKELWKIAKK